MVAIYSRAACFQQRFTSRDLVDANIEDLVVSGDLSAARRQVILASNHVQIRAYG